MFCASNNNHFASGNFMQIAPVCSIGGSQREIKYDDWAKVVESRPELELDSFTGRDPATGAPVEYPPSAMLVTLSVDGVPRGQYAYDEEHFAIIGATGTEQMAFFQDYSKQLAIQLGCDVEEF